MKRFVLLAALLVCIGCTHKPLYKDTRVLMGTFVEVISPDKNAEGIAFEEIKRIEALLSKYNPTSEVSRLNRDGKLTASPETLYCIKQAKELWRLTDGAFDITIAPLITLWGFTDKKYWVPPDALIKESLKLIGSEKIAIDENDATISFGKKGMHIDLGGIAKGYALDCAVKKLKESGITHGLINAGGQIYCLGDKYGQPWGVAIKDPRTQGIIAHLELKDTAVATSGDYEQYFIVDKKRYCHILNSRTGYPAESGLSSVTVRAPTGIIADALATAIFIRGEEEGKQFILNFPGVTFTVTKKNTNE
ncbi:MAG: FAD:protein FMN transferase [Candidatus Omnitrophica bacterium]|nr:FAD:protein FMN transferase [Candidatus Omnitrophota bacterium]